MPATTIALYGSNGQKDVYFGRMLKKYASKRRSLFGLSGLSGLSGFLVE
jgi:hypothetical protein